MVRATLTLVGCLALVAIGSARDDDPVKTELDKAKSVYDGKLEKFRKDVLAKLDEREVAGRKKGDKKLIDRLAEEKEGFEKDNIVPASLTPLGFQRQQNQMRSTLETVYRAAVKKYTTGKKDDEAKAIQKEFDQFQEGFDALKAGTVWGGDMKVRRVSGKGGDYGVKITITDRQGSTFKGHTEVSNGTKFRIEGTVVLDAVEYKDIDKGHKYKGKLSGRELELQFEGFGLAVNERTGGTVKVALVK